MPVRALGFGTSDFLAEYVQLVTAEADAATVAAWLFENFGGMTEAMFFDEEVDWRSLKPFHFLALRACAPDGVFTPAAKEEYLKRVKGNPNLTKVAIAIFAANDWDFINRLVHTSEKVIPQVIELVRMAYNHGIRPTDDRVKNM